MRYFQLAGFIPSLRVLQAKAGKFSKNAQKVWALIGKINAAGEVKEDPFYGIPKTNHGENRIKHCAKYDLTDGCRLITVVNNNICIVCFTGTHEECDKWIEKHRGISFVLNNNLQIIESWESVNIEKEEERINKGSALSEGYLYFKLSVDFFDEIIRDVKRSDVRKIEDLTYFSTDDEILNACLAISDERKQNALFDTLCLIREGDLSGCETRVGTYNKENKPLEEVNQIEIKSIQASETLIEFEQFDAETIEHFMKTSDFFRWMLFMHPEQKKIVEKEYSGPSKLSGVSGSGKTCVLIKRALHLSRLYPDEKVLILTLNKALAHLIESLVSIAAPAEKRKNIYIKSFWSLCFEILLQFEPNNEKIYDENTWKTQEHVDDIWNEFYQCDNNNFDAEILIPVHKSLLGRNIFPQDYIRQEFDWIRSAFSDNNREDYLTVERKGRYEQLDKNYRELLLKGLKLWEDKMNFVGVSDYLGLANTVNNYINRITPQYRCILVDEEQDFSTIELSIIRKLVKEQENDLFLCGDFAQKVYSKNHSYSNAGINVSGRVSTIKKNYRNSREILEAAYSVLKNNVSDEILKAEEYELVDPEFANFSSSMPLILKAENILEELGHSINYFSKYCEDGKKTCIVVCGYSFNEIKKLGAELKLTVLDGNISIDSDKIFLSDLEQTKGFEFDYICILNCKDGVIPNPNIPVREYYRDLSKLYVSMTRAKLELYISYSGDLSSFFNSSMHLFTHGKWVDYEKDKSLQSINYNLQESDTEVEILNLTGKKFIHTKEAVGISGELFEKLITLITGKSLTSDGKVKEWKTIKAALEEKNIPNISQLFGAQKTWPEFKQLFSKYK